MIHAVHCSSSYNHIRRILQGDHGLRTTTSRVRAGHRNQHLARFGADPSISGSASDIRGHVRSRRSARESDQHQDLSLVNGRGARASHRRAEYASATPTTSSAATTTAARGSGATA